MVDHKAGEAGEDLGEALDPESGLRNYNVIVEDSSAVEALETLRVRGRQYLLA